jgi:Family of unknown function (DUF5677)
MALYRHVIEMVDAIEVMVANSCGTAAIPVLRSAFEGMLGLLYLLSDDGKYVDRALSWLVSDIYGGIKARQVLDPGTDKGKQFAQLREKEFANVIPLVPNAEIACEIEHLENILRTAQFAPIAAEYQRTKKVLNRTPEWFSLFGGPQDRFELAESIGMGSIYRLLYGDWSVLSHGGDLHRYFDSDDAGRLVLDAVRRPNEIQSISQIAAIFLVKTSRAMIQKFREGENLEPWYAREVKPLMDKLLALKVTFTPLLEK